MLDTVERNRHRSLHNNITNRQYENFHTFGVFVVVLSLPFCFFSIMRRLLLDSTSVVCSPFFHMVGGDPGFICLRWLGSKALVKQLSSKWTEQITKRVFGSGWKFFLFVLTNRAHASLVFLSFGLACSAIPAARLDPLLQSWTTQRLPTTESARKIRKTKTAADRSGRNRMRN